MSRIPVRGALVAGLFAALTLLAVTGKPVSAQVGPGPLTSDATPSATPTPTPAPTPKPTPPAANAPASGSLANPWVVNSLLGVLGLANLTFLVAFFVSVRKEPRFTVETSWGGFGGGLGGWSLSPSLVYLVATLVLAGMLAMAVSKAASPPPAKDSSKDSTTEAAKGTK
jgi:hypothetical protein